MPDPRRITSESRYLALLRGVNVGKGPRVPMAEWRALLQAQGYREVQTLLNSGNAVFSADGGTAESHAAAISATLAAQLSLRLQVIVLSAERLQRVIAGWPFDLDRIAASQTLVAMTQTAEDLLAMQRIEPLIRPDEQWTIGNEAAYFASTTGLADSKAANALEDRAADHAQCRHAAQAAGLAGRRGYPLNRRELPMNGWLAPRGAKEAKARCHCGRSVGKLDIQRCGSLRSP